MASDSLTQGLAEGISNKLPWKFLSLPERTEAWSITPEPTLQGSSWAPGPVPSKMGPSLGLCYALYNSAVLRSEPIPPSVLQMTWPSESCVLDVWADRPLD